MLLMFLFLTLSSYSKEVFDSSKLEGDWHNSETKSAIRFRFVYKNGQKRLSIKSITALDSLAFTYNVFYCKKNICEIYDEEKHKIMKIQIVNKDKFKCLYFIKLQYANTEGKFQKYVDVLESGRVYSKSKNIRDNDWDGKTEN